MINNFEKIQSNPVKSTISLGIPIIILLVLETVYSITDTYRISGIGFSALVGLGYIANVIYASNKIGDGIGRSVNVLISNELGAKH
nr:MATE family efflux transporter [uncultured Methanobrevibacter sp.]